MEISDDHWEQVISICEKQGIVIDKIGQTVPQYGPDASVGHLLFLRKLNM